MPGEGVHVREMTEADTAGAFALCRSVLFDPIAPDEDHAAFERFGARTAHLMTTDPGGSWVAERDGEITGIAMALVREGVWGLSLFAVAADLQGQGVGRALLDAALHHGEVAGAHGWIIMSTAHPGAIRRYASAGFDLHPAVDAGGVPDLRRAPDAAASAVDAGAGGIPVADRLWREVRGAGLGRDIPSMLDAGGRLLLIEDRAAVIARGAQIWALAARDDEAAALAMWAALTTAPPGATASADCITGAQQWALRVCIDARLDLTPHGPLLTRGRLGPLTPYLPSGAYL
jgi:GNAT superfamily N-acetyltransferase